jgi:hypothetical protein
MLDQGDITTTADAESTTEVELVGQPTTAPEETEIVQNRKYSSKGWEKIFMVSTRVLGEKEIDIDDRETNILFTLEMKNIEPWEFKLVNLEVTLVLTPSLTEPDPDPDIKFLVGNNDNIAVDLPDTTSRTTTGTLNIFTKKDKVELFPGAALNKQLTIRTGAFSATNFSNDPAISGVHRYKVEIDYDLVPVVGKTKNTTYTQLIFYVAAE